MTPLVLPSDELAIGVGDATTGGVFPRSMSVSSNHDHQDLRRCLPHPSLRPRQRVCVCDVDSHTGTIDLRSQLYEEYPGHTEDLEYATFWKASRRPPMT